MALLPAVKIGGSTAVAKIIVHAATNFKNLHFSAKLTDT
jgi:hypothetical protein